MITLAGNVFKVEYLIADFIVVFFMLNLKITLIFLIRSNFKDTSY